VLPLDVVPEVRCPRCGGRACFDEAFRFLSRRTVDPAHPEPVHRWGGWLVQEKYPSVMSWKAPRGSGQFLYLGCTQLPDGFRLRHRGVVRCGECHRVAAHVLRWPDDAFFQWDVRGTRLWALNAEHARALLQYVGSARRDPARYPDFRHSLRKLPAVVLAAKNRDLVVRKIRRTLDEVGETEPPRGEE